MCKCLRYCRALTNNNSVFLRLSINRRLYSLSVNSFGMCRLNGFAKIDLQFVRKTSSFLFTIMLLKN